MGARLWDNWSASQQQRLLSLLSRLLERQLDQRRLHRLQEEGSGHDDAAGNA
jgi:hypothetical protein